MLNLQRKDEEKISIGATIYVSDKANLDAIADKMGMPLSIIIRAAINDFIDKHKA